MVLFHSIKEFYSFVLTVLGLWERFLTAITPVIVAAPFEKQRDANKGHPNQPLTST
jgi:hypothetical protein